MRRNVGRVGFHDDGVFGQRLRQAAQLQGALVGHGAAEPELETQGDERLRLLHTAVEGMGDAAAHRHFAQALEQAVGRAAHVQDHRQAEAPRQLQLRAVKAPLARWVKAGHEAVEPDLAHRDQARVGLVLLQRAGQRLQVFVGGARRVERVDAQGVAVAMALRELAHHIPLGALHGRDDAVRHARRARLGAHGVHVGGELGRVEVAVGVDPARHGLRAYPSRPSTSRSTRSQRAARVSSCVTSTKAVLCSRARRSMS